VFWKRANKYGAIAAMIAGVSVTFYYMATTQVWLYQVFHGVPLTPDVLKANTWWDILPISAGIFGMPVAMITLIVVSLLTPAPDKQTQDLVEHVRYPNLKGDTMDTAGAAGLH
jgi:cation/acetate symporter